MKTIVYSTQYKKDFKKYRHQTKKIIILLEVVRMLENEEPLPPELKPHMLKGNLKGCMECHIEGDFLLIWIDDDIIGLLRPDIRNNDSRVTYAILQEISRLSIMAVRILPEYRMEFPHLQSPTWWAQNLYSAPFPDHSRFIT